MCWCIQCSRFKKNMILISLNVFIKVIHGEGYEELSEKDEEEKKKQDERKSALSRTQQWKRMKCDGRWVSQRSTCTVMAKITMK